MAMDEVPGSVGTTASLSLRMGQVFFSCASLLFMSLGADFYSYTAFCYQITVMGLVIPWSFTLALADGYCILFKCSLHQSGILIILIIGDWRSLHRTSENELIKMNVLCQVLSVLTLAAASSTASIVDLMIKANGSICLPNTYTCARYQMSAAMAFFSWSLSMASSLINLWLLPSFV